MPPTALLMPRLGMSMEEGLVVRWPKTTGEFVEKGELVLVIESEKTEAEIEAPSAGYLRHVYVDEGETVACGTLLAALTEQPDTDFDPADFARAEAERSRASGGSGLRVAAPAAERVPQAPKSERKPIVPAARATARRLGIDPARVPGSGPGGRVTRADVEAYAAARESLVAVAEGVSLEVPRQGDGPPLLLLPGFGSDASAFALQTPLLAEHFGVRAFHARGIGLSDAPESERYDVVETATDAATAVPGELHVVAASLGCAVAIELALAAPERVASLSLITPFVETNPRLDAVLDAWCTLAGVTTPGVLAKALLPWLFSPTFLADAGRRGRTERGLAQMVGRSSAAGLERSARGLRHWSGSRCDALGKIEAPTLIVSAEQDLLVPGAAAIAAAVPRARHESIPGAGHAVALEAPDAVGELLLAHLRAG